MASVRRRGSRSKAAPTDGRTGPGGGSVEAAHCDPCPLSRPPELRPIPLYALKMRGNSLKLALVFVAPLLVLAGGCASDQASRYFASERYPAKPAEQVDILNAPPSRPYEIIAEFQSRGETPQDMRRKAAGVGADAVIVVLAGGSRLQSAEWASESTNTYSRIIGSAIRYK